MRLNSSFSIQFCCYCIARLSFVLSIFRLVFTFAVLTKTILFDATLRFYYVPTISAMVHDSMTAVATVYAHEIRSSEQKKKRTRARETKKTGKLKLVVGAWHFRRYIESESKAMKKKNLCWLLLPLRIPNHSQCLHKAMRI